MLLNNNIKIFCILIVLTSTVLGKITVSHPDDDDVERPCSFDDIKCMRKEYNKRGWCRLTNAKKQPADKPLEFHDQALPIGAFNMTFNQKHVVYDGLDNGEIIEFYINKKTDKAVVSFKFCDVCINSTAAFEVHRTAKEDLVINTKTTEHYDTIITTTILTGLKKKNPKVKTHFEIPAIPEYSVGDKDEIKNIDDPTAKALFDAIIADPGSGVQEMFLLRADIMARFYAQNVICYEH